MATRTPINRAVVYNARTLAAKPSSASIKAQKAAATAAAQRASSVAAIQKKAQIESDNLAKNKAKQAAKSAREAANFALAAQAWSASQKQEEQDKLAKAAADQEGLAAAQAWAAANAEAAAKAAEAAKARSIALADNTSTSAETLARIEAEKVASATAAEAAAHAAAAIEAKLKGLETDLVNEQQNHLTQTNIDHAAILAAQNATIQVQQDAEAAKLMAQEAANLAAAKAAEEQRQITASAAAAYAQQVAATAAAEAATRAEVLKAQQLVAAETLKQANYDSAVGRLRGLLESEHMVISNVVGTRTLSFQFRNGEGNTGEVINTYTVVLDNAGTLAFTGDTPRAFWLNKRLQAIPSVHTTIRSWVGSYSYWWNNSYNWAWNAGWNWGWYNHVNRVIVTINTYKGLADGEAASVAKWNALVAKVSNFARTESLALTGLVSL